MGAGLQPLDGWIVIVKPVCFCVFCISLFVFASLYFSFTFVVSQLIWWLGCVRCSLYAAYAVHPAQPLKSPKTANRHSFSAFQHFPDYSFSISNLRISKLEIFLKKYSIDTLYIIVNIEYWIKNCWNLKKKNGVVDRGDPPPLCGQEPLPAPRQLEPADGFYLGMATGNYHWGHHHCCLHHHPLDLDHSASFYHGNNTIQF